jgi:uncharacterized protein YggU (UPF0235/DUF167 family)
VPPVPGRPWVPAPGGLRLTVRLTPKGGRDAIDGIEPLADGSTVLKVRVRAAPHEGAANEALVRLMAAELGIRRSGVALVAGASARVKRLQLGGDPATLATALEKLVGSR